MRKIIKCYLSIIVLGIFSFNAQSSVISNPGFETGGLAPWVHGFQSPNGGTPWNVTNLDAHTGHFSATSLGNFEIKQSFSPVLTNLITEISFWVKRLGDGPNIAIIFDYQNNEDFEFRFSTSTNDWELFNLTPHLELGHHLIGISIFGNQTGCPLNCTQVFIDDVVISTVPEPNTIILLSLSLLILVAYKRFKKNTA